MKTIWITLAALPLGACISIAPAPSFDDVPPDFSFSVAGALASVSDCSYAKIEHFWHFGSVRHVDDIRKTDLPSEHRVQIDAIVTDQAFREWRITFLATNVNSVQVDIRKVQMGAFELPYFKHFYEVDVPGFVHECAGA